MVAIWWHGSGSTLAQVMAWYRRQQAITWANADKSSLAILTVQIQWIFVNYYLGKLHEEIFISKIFIKSLRGQWIKKLFEEKVKLKYLGNNIYQYI